MPGVNCNISAEALLQAFPDSYQKFVGKHFNHSLHPAPEWLLLNAGVEAKTRPFCAVMDKRIRSVFDKYL
jgi:hypothetical protein